jgi:hypothetical protein
VQDDQWRGDVVTNGGVMWSPKNGSGTLTLPDVPTNTISIEPSFPSNLWVGTDGAVTNTIKGSLFKSTDGGDTWHLFANGLPNSPVYEISIDETHGRVYAATHGRGIYVITKPFLSNFEGWVNGQMWDIPVYGNGFLGLSPQTCTMQIIRQNGTSCASGSVDAVGGTIQVDNSGQLVTTKNFYYGTPGRPVALACFNGTCLNNTPISACNQPGNPVTTVTVTCGGLVGVDHVLNCPQENNPPSTNIGFSGVPAGLVASAQAKGISAQAAPLDSGGQGAFDLVASVQAGDGSTRALCGVNVAFQNGEDPAGIIQRARDALNSNPDCTAKGVKSVARGIPVSGEKAEDAPLGDPRLGISAPSVNGTQLVTSLHVRPGQATNSCFVLSGVGVPVLDSLIIMRATLETAPGGAAGGQFSMTERTALGTCSVNVPTVAAESASQIASALEAAFQAPGIPGPADCPALTNARDVTADGNSVISVMASELILCSRDSGLGFVLAPDELPPSAVNAVQPVRILTFVASPLTIREGESAILTWTTENAIDVTITNVGRVSFNGSTTVKPLVDTVYTVNATGEQSHANAFVLVKVIPQNPALPPVADAGANKWTYANTAMLSGIKSYDPQGSPLKYSRRFVAYQPNRSNPSGTPSVPTITGADTVTPTIKMYELGDYIFELTVTNALGLSSKAVTASVGLLLIPIRIFPIRDTRKL